jgi:hypothetical protein
VRLVVGNRLRSRSRAPVNRLVTRITVVASRRICRARPHRRTEDGPCLLSGARPAEVRRCSEVASRRSGYDTVVKLMDELFVLDARARSEGMEDARRHARRIEKPRRRDPGADPRYPEDCVLPRSAAGKAAHDRLALWTKLTRFLECPELELSNNLAENSMRPISIGRKNWIHVGQCSGRTQGGRDPLHGRKLSQAWPADSQLSRNGPLMTGHPHPIARPAHPSRSGRSQVDNC